MNPFFSTKEKVLQDQVSSGSYTIDTIDTNLGF